MSPAKKTVEETPQRRRYEHDVYAKYEKFVPRISAHTLNFWRGRPSLLRFCWGKTETTHCRPILSVPKDSLSLSLSLSPPPPTQPSSSIFMPDCGCRHLPDDGLKRPPAAARSMLPPAFLLPDTAKKEFQRKALAAHRWRQTRLMRGGHCVDDDVNVTNCVL